MGVGLPQKCAFRTGARISVYYPLVHVIYIKAFTKSLQLGGTVLSGCLHTAHEILFQPHFYGTGTKTCHPSSLHCFPFTYWFTSLLKGGTPVVGVIFLRYSSKKLRLLTSSPNYYFQWWISDLKIYSNLFFQILT